MNIFALIKRTFDTEEKKSLFLVGESKRMALNLSSILMTNTQLKKQSKCVTLQAVK